MKLLIYILITTGIILLTCNNKLQLIGEPRFVEIVIDDQAPQNLWMKDYGDLNGDGKADIIVGGQKTGGIVAYFAPDWQKKMINGTLNIGTDAEVCDLNADGTQDIVLIVRKALIWLTGPEWKYNHIDSIGLHDVQVADFNNDGTLDIVARNQAEFNSSGNKLFFYIQKPNGKWNKYSYSIIDGEGIKVADIDKNGSPDIIINGCWLENTGNIENWIEHKFTDTWKWRNTYIDFADINGDGKPNERKIIVHPINHFQINDLSKIPLEELGLHCRIRRKLWRQRHGRVTSGVDILSYYLDFYLIFLGILP